MKYQIQEESETKEVELQLISNLKNRAVIVTLTKFDFLFSTKSI